MTSVFRISLDIHQTQSQVSIPATQGADNVRLIIRLTEKGNPFDIEDGSYAIFSAVKPDGNPLYNDCAIYRNSTIVYDFTPQTTAVEGVTKCQIHLYDTYGRKLHSPRFMIVVHPDIYDSSMESTEEFSVLSRFLKEKGDLEHDVDQNTEKIANNYQILQSHTKSIALLNPLIPSAVITTIPTTAWEQASKNEPYTATLGEVGDHQHVTIWGLDNVTIEWLNVNRPAVPILNGEIVLTASAKPSKELTLAMLTEPYAVEEEDDKAYSFAELVGLTDEAVRLNLGKRMTLAETRLDSAEVIGGHVEIKASDWDQTGTTIKLPIKADTLTLLWPENEVSTTIVEKQGIFINQSFVDDEDDEVLLIRVVEEAYNGALKLRYIRLPMVNEESQQAAVLLIGAKYSPSVGSGGGNGDVVIRPDPHVILTIAADSWSETKSIGLTTWITGAIPLDDITPQTMIRLSALDADTAADWSAGQTGAEITCDEETETYSLLVGIIGDKPTADWQILMETSTVEETEGVTGPWVSVIPPVSDATDKVAVHNYDEAAHPDLRDLIKGLDAEAVGADPAGTAESKTGDLREEIDNTLKGYDNATAVNRKINEHNVSTESHQDLRLELQRLADRLNAALNSDDTSLDDLKEIVAYIKSNKTLIDGITSSKVNVTDIVNNLTTNTANVPLSAAQGVALKLLIDSLEDVVEGKVTAEQVAAQIKAALDPYITKDAADKTYQPKGDYLTPDTGDQRYAKPADIPTVPTKLPNPNPLTINGKTYDGSSPVNVTVEGSEGDADTVDIYLNDEDVAVVGHEYNLYHYAVVHGKKPYTEYDIAVTLSYVDDNGKTVNVAANNFSECFRFTPTEARDYTLTYLVREIKCDDPKNEYIAQKTITLHVIEDTTVSGKKVLFIGDSFTDAGYWPAEIQHNLSGGGIVSVGTRTDTVTIGDQSLTVAHEGREGWATWDYAGTSASMMSKFTSASNVFRNPSTNKFDLAYYMTTYHPGVTLNAVCVFLGTNGLGAITSVVNGMTEMITCIREYDATVPILLHYTLQNVGQDYWGKFADQKSYTRWYRQHLWRDQYGEYKRLYSGMDNVYIVPVYQNLDYDLDFPHKEFAASARNPATVSRVTDGHPSKEGYLKMADSYYAYLLRYMREGGEVEEPDEPDEPDEPTVSYTNLADPSKASANPSTALSADQWLDGYYISNKVISTKADLVVTNKIPMSASDTIRIKGFAVEGTIGGSNCKSRFRLLPCKSDGTALISEVYPAVDQATQGTGYLDYMDSAELANGVYCFCPNDTEKASYWANVAFVRICGYPIVGDNSNVIVTVNEPIA